MCVPAFLFFCCKPLFMKANSIQVRKTARYFTIGKLAETTKSIWFVCHGYGQLASYFLQKFEVLDDNQTFIVAPEALNRFYLEGFSGRVGATWMTKEERLQEIDDYVHYLNELYSAILSNTATAKVTINILGFSQGVATVCRWIANRQIKANNLILWAGKLPHDMNLELTKEMLSHTTMYVVYGRQDEFLKDVSQEEYINGFLAAGLNPRIIAFDGKHEIHQETLLNIAELLVEKK